LSTIPPNWLSSIVQSQGAQERAAGTRAREDADQTERTSDAAFAERLRNVIENDDRDSSVYSDAEGAGSQGRPHSEEQSPEHEQPPTDDSSTGGLDVRA